MTVSPGYLPVAGQTGQPCWDADLRRLDGDLLLATDAAAGDPRDLMEVQALLQDLSGARKRRPGITS
jgi:hypothetical protein